MRKFLMFLSSTFVLTAAPINIIGCGPNNNQNNGELVVPKWVYNMANNNSDQVNIGYDHYSLNTINHKSNAYNNNDWLDVDLNNGLYLYLPEANNIDQAITQINVDDSAHPGFTEKVDDTITWSKVNDTTYGNNNFITEDTTINGVALLDKTKFNEIKESKAKSWTKSETQGYEDFATMPPNWSSGSIDGKQRTDQNWWNGNGWEKLLSNEPTLPSTKPGEENKKISQLDLYKQWIGKKTIGMNVPLSLMSENTFTLQATKVNHVFFFQATSEQIWVSGKGPIIKIPTPHWGFTLLIKNDEETIFRSPQLIHLENAFKEDNIRKYLDETTKNYSFNSQQTTKYQDLYIED